MKIFYCRIGWMSSYRGCSTEKPINGGLYNKDNIGHEVYNYLGYNGRYYGFVEPGRNSSIHIDRLGARKNDNSVNDILVVWVASNPTTGGQYIIGWYKDAIVYRKLEKVPDDAMSITQYKYKKGHISKIEKDTSELLGQEKEAVVKTRINQDIFRKRLVMRYKHCCLCSVNNEKLLIASHIKPWSDSDSYEKLDMNNGLLLCPNHDKLFDSGLISFDDNGSIMLSNELDSINRVFLNVNENMNIIVDDDNAEYIKYHRENVYKV